eukprot:g3537.t1
MLVSILLHVLVFFALDQVKIAFGIQQPAEITTEQVAVRQVEVQPYEPEKALPPEEMITPPDESAALLEEIDLLDMLPEDTEIDIDTSIVDPEFALKMSNPLSEGEMDVVETEMASNFDIESSLPELGRMEEDLKPAALGQLTVDPGAMEVEDPEMTSFTDELLKNGNSGLVENGKLDGVQSLDQLLDLPPNLLLSKKTLLPSDLIFEFNKAELRESAKIGLMKLALLIDKNPSLYCWIEGHTDLIGSEESNLVLSKKRAESVKNYLVESMRMDPERIITRGYGESQPLITAGDADAQAGNRRVEIKMRKTTPPDAQIEITPKAKVIQPKEKSVAEEPAPPKAILVKPKITPEQRETAEQPPKALVVPQLIETVLMGYDGRFTACLSSQAGCAMGCVFCATGQMGFVRHLRVGEIVAQILHVRRALAKSHPHRRLRNIVLMGMGEPLHNYDAVMKAMDIASDRAGSSIGPSRIAISTVGLVPNILRMAEENRPYRLAVSLHGSKEEERAALVPTSKKWNLEMLIDACRSYCATTGKRIFFEWTLIEGKNDSPETARRLATLLEGINSHVNIIPLNPTNGFSGTASGSGQEFQKILREAGIPCTFRQRRGIDNPTTINLANSSAPPSAEHWFGTDQLGRDLFSRVLYGGQVSLLVGLVATAVAVIIGVIYGAVSGYIGGMVDSIMMRFVDIMFALPFLVLVILFALVVDEPSSTFTNWVIEVTGWSRDRVAPITTLIPLFIAIGAIGWLTIARIVRAQVMSIKRLEFVEAAISLGLSRTRILFRHILPNVIGPIIIYTTLAVPGIMLLESALSELSGTKDFNGVLNKFAAWSGAAKLEDFFSICWVVAAVALLFPLVEWLRLGNSGTDRRPWSLRLPHGATSRSGGQPVRRNRWGMFQGVLGFLMTFVCFLLIGYGLVKTGSFAWAEDHPTLKHEFWADFGLMLVVAYLVEIFFRCVVLGVFLRAMKPVPAVVLAGVMFASVQLVMSGFAGHAVVDDESLTPFRLAGMLFLSGGFSERVFVVFLPWFAFGCVLGWARWRTASLWLPVGLLMGWLLAGLLFSKAANPIPIRDKMTSLVASDSLHSGIIPLLGVVAIGGFVHLMTHGYSFKTKTAEVD